MALLMSARRSFSSTLSTGPDLCRVIAGKDVLMKNQKDVETGTNLLIEDLTKLLEDPETSDFTLKCGSKTFKVHKNILGARSSVFKAMFQYGMKEAATEAVGGRPWSWSQPQGAG